jgi:hypothetical protein
LDQYYDEMDLACGKDDDPTLVLRSAILAKQKDLAP